MGRIGAFGAGLKAGWANGRCAAGRIGCAGVPKAGEEEKMFVSDCFRNESIVWLWSGMQSACSGPQEVHFHFHMQARETRKVGERDLVCACL